MKQTTSTQACLPQAGLRGIKPKDPAKKAGLACLPAGRLSNLWQYGKVFK